MLAFRNYTVGWESKAPLLRLESPPQGVSFWPGVHLLIAPNGLGKTTLLQTLAGIRDPLRGEATWNGDTLLSRAQVTYVSEYLSFPNFIYPKEWIEFVGGKHGTSAELDHWAARFGMTSKMNRFLGRMSQGERRKVTWLSVLESTKPILLMDEPLDGLDLLAIRSARELLVRWKREGRVVILVAHQVAELLDLADQVVFIHENKLQSLRNLAPEIHSPVSHQDLRAWVERLYP